MPLGVDDIPEWQPRHKSAFLPEEPIEAFSVEEEEEQGPRLVFSSSGHRARPKIDALLAEVTPSPAPWRPPPEPKVAASKRKRNEDCTDVDALPESPPTKWQTPANRQRKDAAERAQNSVAAARRRPIAQDSRPKAKAPSQPETGKQTKLQDFFSATAAPSDRPAAPRQRRLDDFEAFQQHAERAVALKKASLR
eukprot:TRINITY_DN56736_c0_g1_i1.p1 TRINITY_DN56736_c0_g1~~TRINITY_DN56736_c0_g1_i1.p1  ORF type:complete len:194 (+),score=25.68 TRINITY_DN56736_c0_g1_i1:59-640(+)